MSPIVIGCEAAIGGEWWMWSALRAGRFGGEVESTVR